MSLDRTEAVASLIGNFCMLLLPFHLIRVSSSLIRTHSLHCWSLTFDRPCRANSCLFRSAYDAAQCASLNRSCVSQFHLRFSATQLTKSKSLKQIKISRDIIIIIIIFVVLDEEELVGN